MHNPAPARYRNLLLAAAILVYLVILTGGAVSASGSAGACPDWPTCLGSFAPPSGDSPLIAYAHRLFTALAAPLVIAAAFSAWRSRRSPAPLNPLLTRPVYLSLATLAAQVALGALLALFSPTLRPWMNAAHLALSLVALAALSAAAAAAFYPQLNRPSFRSPFGRLALLTAAGLFILLVSGAVVKATGAAAACQAWPVCRADLAGGSPAAWLAMGHRVIVALAGALMLALLLRAWRTQRTQAPVIVAATAAAVLFFAQALLGAQLVAGYPAYLLGLHQATAVAVWAAIAVVLAAVGLAARTAEDERLEAQAIHGRRGVARDLLMLTKPIVVLLLLVTTYAGMVIGAKAWPPAWLTFWTLLGGFLAAGGSGAINQYIDREDDQKMQRTQKRPIPSGKLTPGEGLAFGVGTALASFYLLTAFVNFLAALLSLAGIFYYVLLYSIFLKKTTVQNIVIGGGAGSIPPLVGWAAATGSLNFPALLLFAIVFMWTPPHFWALAIVRSSDYARAGVPMLPVVRGESETRWQILVYTIELVGLTLLLPLFGLGGAIYLASALALGVWLLAAAYKVWKTEGNKVAWKMYRYSSMYLAFLFFALMIDRLIL
ncbi:MAG: heme o synthase [Chloroflexota bacterium]